MCFFRRKFKSRGDFTRVTIRINWLKCIYIYQKNKSVFWVTEDANLLNYPHLIEDIFKKRKERTSLQTIDGNPCYLLKGDFNFNLISDLNGRIQKILHGKEVIKTF